MHGNKNTNRKQAMFEAKNIVMQKMRKNVNKSHSLRFAALPVATGATNCGGIIRL